ncbi:MAG TPA: lipoprotein-releasing ABC transporter permease subunit [Candidatus Acidoferrales bacterium]|nr:lipoprotein-releasing ABC transporter permease subunit [Candidatus Acidoferrales bacterium]
MRYELAIGLRYLRAKRKEAFVSWITAISTVGLIIGVMTLNIVLAVYTGFEEDLRDRILSFNPHLIVLSFSGTIADPRDVVERVEQVPNVEAAAPFIFGQAMLASGPRVTGVVVRGTGPASERVVTIESHLIGKVDALEGVHHVDAEGDPSGPEDLPGLIVGKDVASQLKAKVGSVVNVISPAATTTAVGLVPKVKRFVIVGLFNSGMSEYDSSLVYMDLHQAQEFFNLGAAVTGIEVRTADMFASKQVAAEVGRTLGFPYRVRDWIDINHNLFSALQIGKTVYFIVLLLIILVAAFNIVSALIMVVMEKRKDIAILKSMGATRASVRRIFVSKGMIIGGVGTVVGSVAALIICLVLQRYHFIQLPPDVYGMDTLQVRIYPQYFLLVAVAAMLISLLATLYPSRQAARLSPVDVIRYE